MVVSRVSTANLHQRTISDSLRVQSDLANLQNQVSSGMKSDNFQGLTGKVETFVQLEAKMKKSQTLVETNTLLVSRLQTTEVALDQIIDLADDYKNLLLVRNNAASGDSVEFTIAARTMLETVAAQLNTSQEGRYLFGGTKTDTAPVVSPVPGSALAGVPDDNYYQGSNIDMAARVQENYTITYGVRANDPAFQKLIAAFNLGLNADASGSTEMLGKATELVQEALNEVIAVRARVQQNIVSIEDINARSEQLNLYWKGFTEQISKTDTVSASIEIATNQAILQASFQAYSTISSLRLTDFIR